MNALRTFSIQHLIPSFHTATFLDISIYLLVLLVDSHILKLLWLSSNYHEFSLLGVDIETHVLTAFPDSPKHILHVICN